MQLGPAFFVAMMVLNGRCLRLVPLFSDVTIDTLFPRPNLAAWENPCLERMLVTWISWVGVPQHSFGRWSYVFGRSVDMEKRLLSTCARFRLVNPVTFFCLRYHSHKQIAISCQGFQSLES